MHWRFPYLGETKVLNEATRSSAPGSFIRLSDGFTHYELGGPQGQKVVLVHGFSVPYFIWDPTFHFLSASGFRMVRYDLFGRGFSDRPKVRYNIDLFCKQLIELTDTLGFDRFNLIGLSLGGPISATMTARYPERISKLVLIDPAGARPVTLANLLKAASAPDFGKLVFSLFGSGGLAKSVEFDFHDPALSKDFVEKYMVQTQYKGFIRALISTIRNGMLRDFIEAYRKVGDLGIPTMLFWGRDDRTVPFAYSDDILDAIPQVEFHAFDRCGHLPHYEKTEEANPLLLEFLR